MPQENLTVAKPQVTFDSTPRQSPHGFSAMVHSFSAKTKALTHKTPPAAQARKLKLLSTDID